MPAKDKAAPGARRPRETRAPATITDAGTVARTAPNGGEKITGADEGVDPGGYPVGLLMWGQAGVYNGADDRLMITAVTDSQVGVVKPARCTAGAGLSINIPAGWMAIADCEDGTTAVVGSRQTHTVGTGQGVQAGPASGGAREDLLWCDTYPDLAQWKLSVIRRADSVGRPGVPLASITVPQGANLASQFTFADMVPSFGSHADGTVRMIGNTTTPTYVTPAFPISPRHIRPRSRYTLNAWGWGLLGGTINHNIYRTPLANGPWAYLNPTVAGSGFNPGEGFTWEAEASVQVRMFRQNISIKISASMCRGHGPADQPYISSVTPRSLRIVNVTTWNPDVWNQLGILVNWTTMHAAQTFEGISSTFTTIEPWD
jgi:hypothetical protein